MHQTVYGHRNRLITDFMLERGLKAAAEQELIPSVLVTAPTADNYEELAQSI